MSFPALPPIMRSMPEPGHGRVPAFPFRALSIAPSFSAPNRFRVRTGSLAPSVRFRASGLLLIREGALTSGGSAAGWGSPPGVSQASALWTSARQQITPRSVPQRQSIGGRHAGDAGFLRPVYDAAGQCAGGLAVAPACDLDPAREADQLVFVANALLLWRTIRYLIE